MDSKSEHKRIVIVEDDTDILKLLQYELLQQGFDVQSFINGASTIEYLSQKENVEGLALLIIDRILPDMDGLEIIEKFNQLYSKSTKVPILILSALNQENDIVEGLQTGAVDYITKPFSTFSFIQKIMGLLKPTSIHK